jgi:imidazole glycerol-phosphate synthase subunit HisH
VIAVLDYDVGNVGAVANMLRRLGHDCRITADAEVIKSASYLVLPGNGAFDACMRNLDASGLRPLLERRVLEEHVPILGICVGAQMLGHASEEGQRAGLGWLDMQVRRFPALPGLRVPHMGWNTVHRGKGAHAVGAALEGDARFYFVHSYYMDPVDPDDVIGHSHHGVDFAAAVGRGNIVGTQFHPEKSHRFGKRLLAAFAGGALPC